MTAGQGAAGAAVLEVRALRPLGLAPVSFTARAGECLAVQGPSGSGKTVLLRAIADLDPSQGTVRLDGQDRDAVPAPAWRRQVRFIAAEPGWWADTVAEHFNDWQAVAPRAKALNLPEGIGRRAVIELSTGERQRLALLRALETPPRVLLLDEPTAALDPDTTVAAEELVAAQARAGATVLWATHDREQAARVARRRLLVAEGRVREEASE